MKILNIIFGCGLWAIFLSAQATAIKQEATGPSAKNFIDALRLSADIHPKKASSHYTYDVDSVFCHSSSADNNEDGLQSYDCTINSNSKTTITRAQAKLLYDAMEGLNIWDEPGMSQNRLSAEHVHCLIRFSQYSEERYHCWWRDPR